jgi:hypothetical protein
VRHKPKVAPRHAGTGGRAASGRRIRRGARGGILLVLGLLALSGGLIAGAVLTGSVGSVTDKLNLHIDALDPLIEDVPDSIPTGEAEPAPSEAIPASPVAIDFNVVLADGVSLADHYAGVLSRAVPTSASGTLITVPGSEPAPDPTRTVRTVRVEVEAGLDVNPQAFADFVMDTLNDPRSWGGDGSMSFARTDGAAHIRVVLASPTKVDQMCAPLYTHGDYSCGHNGYAAINYTRWVQGTEEFPDLTVYRHYVVNHEMGHLLGRQHVSCPGAGQLAPAMQQQSIRVAPCIPNAWPFPDNGI